MVDFNFCFKGSRTYVHGSDMFNAVSKHLRSTYGQSYSHIDFMSINHRTSKNLKGDIINADEFDPSRQPVAVMRFDIAGAKKALCLQETDTEVNCRYEYDEDGVVEKCSVSTERKNITSKNESPYSPIEVIIALNKKLVQTIFSAEKGKWFFTKLVLRRPLPDTAYNIFSIALKQSLSSRLTCSSIEIAGEYYGDIYFSLVKASS